LAIPFEVKLVYNGSSLKKADIAAYMKLNFKTYLFINITEYTCLQQIY